MSSLRNLNKRQMWLLLIMLFFIVVFVFYMVHMYKVKPVSQEVDQLRSQLETERKIAETLEKQIDGAQNEMQANTTKLQKQIPVDPLLESFLFDLEKAEIISDSFISSMSFGVGAFEVDAQDDSLESQIQEYEAQKKKVQNAAEGEKSDTEETSVSTLPEGVERLTVNLSVESPSYYAMEEFLRTIESLDRTTKVDSLSFSGGQEVLSIDDEAQPLNYNLTISTFFFPELEELKDELPLFEIPEPSNKKNPLAGGSYTEPIGEEEPAKGDEQPDIPTYINHKVKENETIFSISMHYYGDKTGMELIVEENNIHNNKIIPGQVLRIPMNK